MAHSANEVAGRNEAGISGTSIDIKIKTNNSQTYTLQVDKQMPVPALKEHIASVTGVETENQRLICHGKDLQDDQLLSVYDVEDGHTVHLVVQELNASSSGSLPADPVCSFVRKPIRNKNIRKRITDEIEDGSEESSVLPAGKRSVKTDNKLYFSSGTSKRSLPAESTDDSQNMLFQYESSKDIQIQNDSKATATLETETDFSRDARAIRERALKQAEEGLKGKNKTADGEKVYKGMHSYTDYRAGFRREQTVAAEKAGGAHGPLRASAHIRVSARFDYQPDICKDYKETGYCGYGDSCKFMHDRGDYKSGWLMEKEWDETEKARKRNLALKGHDSDEDIPVHDEEDDDDGLPFACFICRQPFVDPVMTKCKHYFCEHCALKHHSRNKKCFVCNQPTLGIFNTAHEIRKRMAADKK